MITLSESTRKYLTRPDDPRFVVDRLHLAVTTSIEKTLSHFIADFYNPCPYTPSGRREPCTSMRDWIQAFPESKRIVKAGFDTLRFELPVTDMVCERIHACIPYENISFENPETELVYQKVLIRGKQADRASQVYSDFKINNIVPTHNLVHSTEYPLLPYQQVGLYNSINSDAYALFMEQGTGKTPIGVALICNEAEENWTTHNRMYRALIVCPKNVRANWENEFKKFATTTGKVTILHGGHFDRVRQLLDAFINEDGCKYSVVLCSYETMARSWKAIEGTVTRLRGGKWDLALLDESHSIKNVTTKRYKFAKKLRDLSKRRSILTGTPITNTALDLYTQLEFLGEGYSGFYDYKYFRKFFTRHQMDQATGREVFDGIQNVPFLQERLARYSYIVRQVDVQSELPDRVYDTLEVEMSPQQTKTYEAMRDELIIEIESDLANTDRNAALAVNSVLTRLLKLAQITSGFISIPELLDDDGNVLTLASINRFDPDPKLEELVAILKAKSPKDKTIIWSCWVQNIKTIRARLAIEGIDCVTFFGKTKDAERVENEYRFNCDPNCKVFIGNPAAGGTGLNLIGYPPEGHAIYKETGKTLEDWETNANHVIYYSQNWSPTARSQSEKRAHRRGTREPVRVTDLVVPNTIDQEIRDVVLNKQVNALELSDLRKILQKIALAQLECD